MVKVRPGFGDLMVLVKFICISGKIVSVRGRFLTSNDGLASDRSYCKAKSLKASSSSVPRDSCDLTTAKKKTQRTKSGAADFLIIFPTNRPFNVPLYVQNRISVGEA